jgi:hypothetical protein
VRRINSDVQRHIVVGFAQGLANWEIAASVSEAFNVSLDRRRIEAYNPKRGGVKPARKWCRLFDVARAEFLATLDELPIAHRVYRLRELQDMHQAAKRKGNYPLAAQILEQAAKEVGDAYTNRRELTGKDGRPLVPEHDPYDDLTAEELSALVLKMVGADNESAAMTEKFRAEEQAREERA